MTDEPTNPESLYPEDPERPEPVEDEPFDPNEGEGESVEVSAQELADLGEFLTAIQQVIINIQERLLTVEAFLGEVFGGATDQGQDGQPVDPSASEGGNSADEGGTPKLHIVGDLGDESDGSGTEVPSDSQ